MRGGANDHGDGHMHMVGHNLGQVTNTQPQASSPRRLPSSTILTAPRCIIFCRMCMCSKFQGLYNQQITHLPCAPRNSKQGLSTFFVIAPFASPTLVTKVKASCV